MEIPDSDFRESRNAKLPSISGKFVGFSQKKSRKQCVFGPIRAIPVSTDIADMRVRQAGGLKRKIRLFRCVVSETEKYTAEKNAEIVNEH
jgi:hypothetical protein